MASPPKTYTEFLEHRLEETKRVLVAVRNEANIVHSHEGFVDGYTHVDALARIHEQARQMVG